MSCVGGSNLLELTDVNGGPVLNNFHAALSLLTSRSFRKPSLSSLLPEKIAATRSSQPIFRVRAGRRNEQRIKASRISTTEPVCQFIRVVPQAIEFLSAAHWPTRVSGPR